jgi:hypothetical protein
MQSGFVASLRRASIHSSKLPPSRRGIPPETGSLSNRSPRSYSGRCPGTATDHIGLLQAVSIHLPTRLWAVLGQSINEVLPIHVISANRLPPIPSAHDVVNCFRIFDRTINQSASGCRSRSLRDSSAIRRRSRWGLPPGPGGGSFTGITAKLSSRKQVLRRIRFG